MLEVLPILVFAAALEVAGDAAIRYGLVRSSWSCVAAGAAALVVYGVVVNTNRVVDFGRLMGTYIAVFFVVAQVINWTTFRGRPSPALILGGALIIAGAFVIQRGAP